MRVLYRAQCQHAVRSSIRERMKLTGETLSQSLILFLEDDSENGSSDEFCLHEKLNDEIVEQMSESKKPEDIDG